ncbi:MAG: DUF3450 domain-containing protein [Pseudomonadales bacterium]
MHRFRRSLTATLLAAATTLIAPPSWGVDEALQTQQRSDDDAADSQKRIDQIADATASALQAYRVALQREESLSIYTKQIERLIASQEAEIESIARQTNEIENIDTGALPLMIEMVDTLEQLLDADVPFQLAERQARVDNLRQLIDRADVTSGEKFRRVMEAYLIEVDFGRTIEAYRGELETEGKALSVDFLRVGRVGLYYQTLDGSTSGRWNMKRRIWEPVDSSFRSRIQLGLRIARKQMPPEMLTLPIVAAGDRS